MKKKILVICAKGLNRSKYLASYLRNKGYRTRFGGIEGFRNKEQAPNPISQKDVDWANVIIIVRKRLKSKFKKKFQTNRKRIITFNVTDSRRLLPKKYFYLKEASEKRFDKEWRKPQLRKAIKKYLPL